MGQTGNSTKYTSNLCNQKQKKHFFEFYTENEFQTQ